MTQSNRSCYRTYLGKNYLRSMSSVPQRRRGRAGRQDSFAVQPAVPLAADGARPACVGPESQAWAADAETCTGVLASPGQCGLETFWKGSRALLEAPFHLPTRFDFIRTRAKSRGPCVNRPIILQGLLRWESKLSATRIEYQQTPPRRPHGGRDCARALPGDRVAPTSMPAIARPFLGRALRRRSVVAWP